ncbi:MAG: HDOD domain-containing protein [Desulfobacteraceae bacterium]|jgi:putative nucleotidyltransferase with HDIG domain|nr:HDOD domain-containing protein [Desulfobacteraceae bacterium]MBC2752740.1 HDOD domain-containing protein [Desulfobacteraceae bacterium]
MLNPKLKAMIRRIDDLPTLPRTVFRITEMINNPRSSARDLAQVITDDQVLTARLLRLVNSSFYGFPQRITTITRAIVLLGFDAIRHLLLTTSVFDIFSDRKSELQVAREKLWDHSLGCAVAAKVIGKQIRHDKIEELFVCALLHDIGKIVSMVYAQEDYAAVTRLAAEKNILLFEAEAALLEYTHADIGRLLAERWNLPNMVADVIVYHHTPDQAGPYAKEAAVVHLADIFCRALQLGSGGDHRMPALDTAAWDLLQLDETDIAPMLAEVESGFNDISPFTDAIVTAATA